MTLYTTFNLKYNVRLFVMFTIFIFECSTHNRSNPVDPNGTNWNPPTIAVMKDTIVAVNDSFYIHAEGSSKGKNVTRYIWEFPDGSLKKQTNRDTTTKEKIKIAFSSPGIKMIKVWALDEDGYMSGWKKNEKYHPGDTLEPYYNAANQILIDVHQYVPVVSIMKDTNVAINDSFYICATASDTNGTIKKYLWALDGANFRDSTDKGSIKVAFASTGAKKILAKVRDNDEIKSPADSINITVHVYAPWVNPMLDTIVNENDNFYIHVESGDTNGTVKKFIWATDGINFKDSTTINKLKINATFLDTGTIQDSVRNKILVKVMDDNSVLSQPCTVIVNLNVVRPWIAAIEDTTITVYDSIEINVKGYDTSGTIVSYIWAMDSIHFFDTTQSNTLKVQLKTFGIYKIGVFAENDKGRRSAVSWIKIIVKPLLDIIIYEYNSNFTCLSCDDNGNKWLGTNSAGLIMFDGTTWMTYSSTFDLPFSFVSTLKIDNYQNKWVGSSYGLFKFDDVSFTAFNTSNSYMKSNDIEVVEVDQTNNIWVGTILKGLFKFNGSTWLNYDTANSGLPSNAIRSISFDKSSRMWIGTNNGLTRYNGKNWETFNVANSDIPKDVIRNVIIDQKDNVWFGAGESLVKFDGVTWHVYNSSNSDLPRDQWGPSAIAIDQKGNKWIGIASNLVKFNDTTWTVFNSTNTELPRDGINAIAVDRNDTKWVAIGRSLIRF